MTKIIRLITKLKDILQTFAIFNVFSSAQKENEKDSIIGIISNIYSAK